MSKSVPLLLLLFAGLASAHVIAPAQDSDPAPTASLPDVNLNAEEVRQRMATLLAESDAGDPDRSHLIDRYRELLRWLDAGVTFRERADAYRTATDIAPSETTRLRTELAARERTPSQRETDEGQTSEQVQRRRNQLQAQLAELRTELADIDRQINEEESRPVQGAEADTRAALLDVERKLAEAPPLGADAVELERIERAILMAEQLARASEIAMLEQQQVSRPARLDLLRARRDLTTWTISTSEARVGELGALLSALRQSEAETKREEAELLRREALGKHPLIREGATEIAEITRELEDLLPRIAAVRDEITTVDVQLERARADFEQTSRSLDLGVTRALGTVLLEQRRSLPNPAAFRRRAKTRSRDASTARLRLFGVERDLAAPTVERAVDGMIASESVTGMSASERADLRSELVELVATRRESLRLLQSALRDFLSALRDLETQEQGLIRQVDELAALLDERLIWIPNAAPLDVATLVGLRSDVVGLLAADSFRSSVAVVRSDVRSTYGLWIAAAIAVSALIAIRRKLLGHLERIAASVGKVRKDRILLTFQALLLQLLYILPFPALLAWTGWRLLAAEETVVATKPVGDGLLAAASVLFGLLFLRTICSPNGAARAHFRWSEHSAGVLRKHLSWYAFVAVPATFVIWLTQAQPDRLARHGVGRVAFIVLMVAATILACALLNRSRGIFIGRSVERASRWLRRSRPLWLPIGTLLPLGLAALAATGYYYAALQIESLLLETLGVILAVLFLHGFLTRWLMVSQRRLALKVALERREAKKNEGDTEEEALAGEGVADPLEEIDVVEIQDQTQDLLRMSLTLFFAFAIWLAWTDVLPALGVFDNVTLWSHQAVVDGVAQQVPITLGNVGLALLALIVTVAAARNMPGFLEIAILQRLPLEPGVRYASRTLALYAIVSVGVIFSFNAIGVGWSSVQWLVAALTVGLGFGLQEIFANFVSGLIILLERPIRVGDTVTVGAVSGVVSRIRMRATTITDWSRRELLVPNKSFITGELINWSLSDPILRVEIPVGFAYGSNTQLAHETMLKVCRDHPLVLDQPEPNVFFTGFGDNALNFEARVFVIEATNQGRSRIVHELLMEIDRACRDLDITIAFPQRDLHFKTSEGVLRVSIEEGDA